MDNTIEELEKKKRNDKVEIERMESQLEEAKEKYHSLQSKITTIKHMTGNIASDAVVEAKLGGIIGKIEDLCDFDPKHATAIQSAAGPRMHFVVTENAEAATNAIKWLKKKRLMKAYTNSFSESYRTSPAL